MENKVKVLHAKHSQITRETQDIFHTYDESKSQWSMGKWTDQSTNWKVGHMMSLSGRGMAWQGRDRASQISIVGQCDHLRGIVLELELTHCALTAKAWLASYHL